MEWKGRRQSGNIEDARGSGPVRGGMGGNPFGRRTTRKGGPQRGNDLKYAMDISFEEACFGIEKEISITRQQTCQTCSGSGAKPGTSPETCKTCGGAGQVRVAQNTPFGQFASVRACDACHGEAE